MSRKNMIKMIALILTFVFCISFGHTGYAYATSLDEATGTYSEETLETEDVNETKMEIESIFETETETLSESVVKTDIEAEEVNESLKESEILPDFSEIPDFLGKGVYTGEQDPYAIMPMAFVFRQVFFLKIGK